MAAIDVQPKAEIRAIRVRKFMSGSLVKVGGIPAAKTCEGMFRKFMLDRPAANKRAQSLVQML